MKLKIEIPDGLYTKLTQQAEAEKCSVEKLIVTCLKKVCSDKDVKRRRVNPPIITSKRPGTLYLDNVIIYELIDFP